MAKNKFQSDSNLLIDDEGSVSESVKIRLMPNDSDEDCAFHPAPTKQILPSGLRRDKMEDMNESPMQADKQRRTEQRYLNQVTSMLRPEVCKEHKFCIGHVPDSPKEIMPTRSSIAPMSIYTRDASTVQAGNSFAKQGGMQGINELQHELIQVSEGDPGAALDERVMQVSFNLNNSNIQHDQLLNPARITSAAVQRDLSFNVLNSHHQDSAMAAGLAQSNSRQPMDADLSGIQHNLTSRQDLQRDGGAAINMDESKSLLFKDQNDNSLAVISPCRKSKVSDVTRLNPWEKVIVTQEGIDNWRAQLYGLDVTKFPKVRPEQMTQELFNELKKKYVAPTKIRAKKTEEEDEDQNKMTQVKSRYMDFQKHSRYSPQHRQTNQVQQQQASIVKASPKQNVNRAATKSPLSLIPQEHGENNTEEAMTDTNSNLSGMPHPAVAAAAAQQPLPANLTLQPPQQQHQQQMHHRPSQNFLASTMNNNMLHPSSTHNQQHQFSSSKPKVPDPKSYKTNVFHKNYRVEDLISILEPTPEQAARQALQQAELEAQEKARIEHRRKERNRKTKVALTQKQKVHAEKLFQSLGGSVSRKELEKTAFNAALVKRQKAASVQENRRNDGAGTATAQAKDQKPTATIVPQQKPTYTFTPARKSLATTVDREDLYQKNKHRMSMEKLPGVKQSQLIVTQGSTMSSRPRSSLQGPRSFQQSIQQQRDMASQLMQNQQSRQSNDAYATNHGSRLISNIAIGGGVVNRFGKSHSQNKILQASSSAQQQSYFGGGQQAVRTQASQFNTRAPAERKKSIYRVFGVKSTAVLNKRVVNTRPLSSYQSYNNMTTAEASNLGPQPQRQNQNQLRQAELVSDMSHQTSSQHNFKMTQSDGSQSAVASSTVLRGKPAKPPMHQQSSSQAKQSITVNARATAAKIVLRNLTKYSQMSQEQLASPLLLPQKQSSSASHLAAAYSSHHLGGGVGGGKLQQDSATSHLMPPGKKEGSSSLSFLNVYLNHGEAVSGSARQRLQQSSQLAMPPTTKVFWEQPSGDAGLIGDNSTAVDHRMNSSHLPSKPSLVRDFTPGGSIEPHTVTGLSQEEALPVRPVQQAQSTERSNEDLRDKLTAALVEQPGSQKRARETAQNAFYSAGAALASQRHQEASQQDHQKASESRGFIDQQVQELDAESLYDDARLQEEEQVVQEDSQAAQEYAEILEHVLEDERKRLGLSGHKSAGAHHTKKHSVYSQQEVKHSSQSLTDLQPCSALFRDFQAENVERKREMRQQRARHPWNLDTTRLLSQKESDRKILKKLICQKHKGADWYINIEDRAGAAYQSSRRTDALEEIAQEASQQPSSSITVASTGSPQRIAPTATPGPQQQPQHQSYHSGAGEAAAGSSSNEHAHLYEDDPKFVVEEMLKDESEDEEEQVNFEINSHKATAINLESSHKYRNEIKDSFFNFTDMNQDEKLEQHNLIRDSDFWLTKGISMTAHNQLSTAIQCYKQTLLLNQDHYVAMHNLAVCYERMDKISSALKWFKRASQIKPTMHFTFIGAAINFFKLGQYNQAAKFVRAAIKEVEKEKIKHFGSLEYVEKDDVQPFYRETSQSFRATINDYNYILSLCLRKLRMFLEAGKLYLSNSKFYRYPDRIDMINSLFGLLLLPMVKDRRMIANELEVINNNLNTFKRINQPIEHPFYGRYFVNGEWKMKFAKHAALELQMKSFFKRFELNDIIQFLPKMKVRQHDVNSVLFPDFDVCIILDGLVESKFHQFGNRIPKPLSKFKEGDVLGFINGDNGKTQHVETWSVCRSKVEAIWMLREDFAALWHLQSKSQKKMLCQVVRMQHCFRSCNDLTVHMIAFELLKWQEFKPGEVIIPMNKRSIINPQHKQSMVPQTNAILKSVLKAREEIDKFGIDRRISSWQLMLSSIAGMAKKAMNKRDSVLLKRKTLRMQLTFEPGGHTRQSSQQRDVPMSQLMENYDRIHDVNYQGGKNFKLLSNVLHTVSTDEDMATRPPDYEHFPLAGIFIIETGRCKILQTDEKGNRKTVSVIGRNDSFGGAEKLKIATLDYLGEIVAGGEIDSVERNVSCLHLTIEDIKRIPEFDLKNFRETIFTQNLPFMQIGARKCKIDIEEMQNY